MPSRTLLICAGIGLLVIGALIGGGLFATRGTHLELEGSIRKTRVAALSSSRSVVVLDFRITNPSDYPFVLKTTEIEVTMADGRKEIGQFIPEIDAKTLFPALPALGDKLAVSVSTGEKIGKKQTVERMAAASFPFPESELETRKEILLRLRDVDGPVSEIR
ncbi:MAG TPA: hypothetical protein VFQ91_10945 [Bryobacteraceae bacterium]|nr:hypothetical protein [Bryobacteraceae bacterium]